MTGLMRHRADVYRPAMRIDASGGQVIDHYARVVRAVPCFVQPQSSGEIAFNQQRGLETSHTVYTNRAFGFDRNDVVEFRGRDLHVVGVRDMLGGGVGYALDCLEYPSTAQKRLDKDDYEA